MRQLGFWAPSLRTIAAILVLFLTSAIPERTSSQAHGAASSLGTESRMRHTSCPRGTPQRRGSGLRMQQCPLLSLRGGAGVGYGRAGDVGDSSRGGRETGIVYDAGFSGDWHDAVVLLVHGPNVRAHPGISFLNSQPTISPAMHARTQSGWQCTPDLIPPFFSTQAQVLLAVAVCSDPHLPSPHTCAARAPKIPSAPLQVPCKNSN